MFVADTNIFIRFFTNDDPIKAATVHQAFQKVESKEIELFITESVFTEIVYVLSSPKLYAVERSKIEMLMKSILILDNTKMEKKTDYLHALDIFTKSRLDIEDCVIIAKAKRMKVQGIFSFDRDLDGVHSVPRIEKV